MTVSPKKEISRPTEASILRCELLVSGIDLSSACFTTFSYHQTDPFIPSMVLEDNLISDSMIGMCVIFRASLHCRKAGWMESESRYSKTC